MQTTVSMGAISFQVEPSLRNRYWKRVGRREWEPDTYAIFDRHITRDTLFLDIGAWIGSTALYGAQLAQKTLAFEPDPLAFSELSTNVALNSDAAWTERLTVHERAINKDGSSFTLGGMTTGADSTSSALFPDRQRNMTVHAFRLPDLLSEHRNAGQPVFLKIDIEGSEYDLLPSIRDILADPLVTAYISFHPKYLRRSLAASSQEGAWVQPFVDAHMAVIDSLPWSRSIELRTGEAVSRPSLTRKLRRRLNFPDELLVRSPGS